MLFLFSKSISQEVDFILLKIVDDNIFLSSERYNKIFSKKITFF